ncbi:putative ribonuclease H-like domain-containing protein [Tanacetum coccineum]|uniref:Ribonuclease H-like domain-containing protein n=1 Tax=Tanacetum coccineum TaxID=301880 RepID=A0ABQ5ESI6_9ASTR
MSNTNLQTQTSNALHNAIMEAGGKDRPPMLAPDNYAQWKSRIKRYIDTKPNNELIHYCLQNPPYKFKWTEKTVPVAEGSSEPTTEGYMENYKNVSQDIRDQLNAEAEAVQIILTGIDNDIYSTVDAYLETNLYWEFEKFTSRDGESLESYYSKFYKMMNELSQELKVVSYHKLYDILKQHQTEVNEIRAERLARTANPLALVAQEQPVYHPQNHPTHYIHNSSTKSQQATTRNKGKAIVNFSTPTYDQEPTMVAEDDEMSKDKEIDKLMALISLSFKKIYKPTNNNLRTSSNTSRVNQDNTSRINRGTGYDNQRVVNVVGPRENVGTLVVQQSRIQCYNCKEYRHVARECQKLKRAKNAAYHKEKMLLYKQEEAVFQLNTEQADWRDATDDEPEDQELEPHYMYMAQIQKDDDDDLAKECDLPASLIEKLQCEIDDGKNRNKFLETSNKALVDKLKDLKKFQAELDRYHDVNYASKVKIDCAKAKGDLIYEKGAFCTSRNHLHNVTRKKAQIKFYKTREDKEIDKVIALENKVKVLDDIVYKTGQSVQTTNMLNRNCKMSFAKPEFLKKAQRSNPHIYDIGCYNDNLALMLAPESDETIRLAKESRSKLSDLIIPFDYDQINADLENFHLCLKEEIVADLRYFNSLEHEVDSLNSQLDTQKTQFLNEIDRLSREYYYADHMNAILGVYTKMDEVTNLQCDYLEALEKCERLEKELSKSRTMPKSFKALQKHAINLELALQQRKPATFSDSLAKTDFSKSKSVTTKNVSNDFSKPVTAQILPQNVMTIFKNTNVIAPGIVSRPQLKSNQLEDRVIPNNSQEKKQEVEDHRRNFKFSNNKTSVTAYNDILNAKTSNVNFVCVTCGKCMLNDNHDMYVLYYINGVNSRTKMPMVVPISTREHKRTVNQSVATLFKRTVASDSTNQKPRHTTRKLYEHLVEIILFIFDFGCSKHMTGNLKLLNNFVEKLLGTVKFGNDQIASILGYGDMGNDLLTDSRGIDLYSITLQDTSTPNPICLMAKATSSQAWLWHRRLSHLNFDTINLLSKNDIVIGLLKLKFVKDHLCSSCTKFLNKTLHAYFATEGIKHETSVPRTPEQNGIVERRNRTLVEAARTMLSAAKVPLYFWAEAIATACFTQNRSLVIPRHEKTPYHIINGRKLSVKFFHIFGSLCYIVRDGENLDKMKEKGDACIFVAYSTQSRAYRVFNKRTRVIVETIHVNFDELPQMASNHVSSDPVPQCPTTVLEHDNLSPGPQSQENVPQAAETVTTSNELDLLFSLMFDELLNGTTQVVSKSSDVTTTDAPNQRQQQHTTPSTLITIAAHTPLLNIQTTPETTSQAPT